MSLLTWVYLLLLQPHWSIHSTSTFYAKVVNLFSLEVSSFPNPEKIAPNQNNSGLSCLKFKKKKGVEK